MIKPHQEVDPKSLRKTLKCDLELVPEEPHRQRDTSDMKPFSHTSNSGHMIHR